MNYPPTNPESPARGAFSSVPPNKSLSLYSKGISSKKLQMLNDFFLPGRVLDIGTGNGLYGAHLAALGCEVLQIDIADRRNERARNLPFCIMDANHLEFEHNRFDSIIAFDIMEHLEDDQAFLQAARKCTRQRIFLSVPNADDEQIASFGLTHSHHKDKTHRREYSQAQLVQLLNKNGFDLLSLQPNFVPGLPRFARALAKESVLAKAAAALITVQCRLFEKLKLFENRSIGDWYCVADIKT